MSFIGKALGKLTGADAQADAAEAAAATQSASAEKGILAQQQALEEFRRTLAPFVNAGAGALSGQQNLIGLNGTGAQQAAIGALEGSPQFAALTRQGEDAILANASAIGGLRGGNIQATLAQFRPQLLAQLIDQQYSRLGGLSALGQNSAAGVGSAGVQTGSNVAQLLQQQGAATAGGQIARGGVAANGFGNLLQLGSTAAALYGLGGLAGGAAGAGGATALHTTGSAGALMAPAALPGVSLPMLTSF